LEGEAAKIRVLLADEQALFREAVKVVLEAHRDFSVVAQAGDAIYTVEEAKRTRPDIALIDAELPNLTVDELIRKIKSSVPECGVVLLSPRADLGTLAASMEAGASGYLTKDSGLDQLVEAARAVHRGETLVPSKMLGPLLGRLIHRGRDEDEAMRKLSRLTRREREVLGLMMGGADNAVIAQALTISPETARTHIQNILGKLDLHSRLEAVAFVSGNGIVNRLVQVSASS
jgi:two-component system, NarL family, nitrate/nitrite response regulator NarL